MNIINNEQDTKDYLKNNTYTEEENQVNINDKIDNYINWFLYECTEPYSELNWLIDLLLNSKHKKDLKKILNITYKHYNE